MARFVELGHVWVNPERVGAVEMTANAHAAYTRVMVDGTWHGVGSKLTPQEVVARLSAHIDNRPH